MYVGKVATIFRTPPTKPPMREIHMQEFSSRREHSA